MIKYDPTKLAKEKYAILGMYIQNLQKLRKGKIPRYFEMYEQMLVQALPYFSKEESKKFKKIINVGSSYLDYFKAKMTVNALIGDADIRRKTIDDFLTEMNSEKKEKK